MSENIAIIENITIKSNQHYMDGMEKLMSNNIFIEESKLLICHNQLQNEIIDKYRGKFNSISEEKLIDIVKSAINIAYNIVKEKNDLFKQKDCDAIGIDLGTTNSCVAYFRPTERDKYNVVIIENSLGKNITPSVVSIRKNEEVVGITAKEQIYAYRQQTVMSVKRIIGRKYKDYYSKKSLKKLNFEVIEEKGNAVIRLLVDKQYRNYYPEEISAKVLRKLKDFASEKIGSNVRKAVITVLAYFNDSQKEATIRAGKLAGLEILRIINEPTAAAIAYRLNWNINTIERNVLVYDFGGGTFDVAVLKISKNIIDVKAVTGDNNLGGDDFDSNLVHYCLLEFETINEVNIDGDEGEKALDRLRIECEEAKIRLSSIKETTIFILNFYSEKD